MRQAYDFTSYLSASIDSVYETLLIATILVILVVFAFLKELKATLIPLVALPVSLIGSFIFIYLAGFTLNIINLLALVLAIGLVVDDAIVMMENIYRHISQGMKPVEAAMKGGREMMFPVISISCTLIAVYAPIGISSGLVSQLFWQFGFTLIVSVAISTIIAITLTPMMCAYLLNANTAHNIENDENKRLHSLLKNCLANRLIIVSVFIFLLALTFVLLRTLPSTLAPQTDDSNITIPFNGMSTANYNYMKSKAAELDKVLSSFSDVEQRIIELGAPTPSQGAAHLILPPISERDKSQQTIENERV